MNIGRKLFTLALVASCAGLGLVACEKPSETEKAKAPAVQNESKPVVTPKAVTTPAPAPAHNLSTLPGTVATPAAPAARPAAPGATPTPTH